VPTRRPAKNILPVYSRSIVAERGLHVRMAPAPSTAAQREREQPVLKQATYVYPGKRQVFPKDRTWRIGHPDMGSPSFLVFFSLSSQANCGNVS
jgi:hypothetical protein